MQDPAASAAILGRLRRLGVGVALDDFGAEYSSLAYLKRLPVTILKIDKSFVGSLLSEDTADASLIAAVVAMARSLASRRWPKGSRPPLKPTGSCGWASTRLQGFLFSRPVTADKLLEVTASLGERRLTLVSGSAV